MATENDKPLAQDESKGDEVIAHHNPIPPSAEVQARIDAYRVLFGEIERKIGKDLAFGTFKSIALDRLEQSRHAVERSLRHSDQLDEGLVDPPLIAGEPEDGDNATE